MKITKFGHACLLIEEADARILIDPGVFNQTPSVEKLDAILITHEHPDHCSVEQIKELLLQSPDAPIYTHEGVGKVLSEADIPYTPIKNGEEVMVNGVSVLSLGEEHAIIYEKVPCQNTGYMIAGKFFFPGDSFYVPEGKVEVLALPTGGPWMKVSEAIEYVKAVKPNVYIPVHDAMYTDAFREGVIHRILTTNLDAEYRHMTAGSVEEF